VGSAAVPFLIGKLDSSHWEKKTAVNALIALGDERAVEPLIKAIDPVKNQGNEREILEALETRWNAIAACHVGLLLNKINEILAIIKPEDDYSRQIIEIILKLVESVLEHGAGEVPDADLRAVAEMKDISIVAAVADLSKTIHGDDGWGYLDYHPTNEVTKTRDCSALREAAGKELMRRGLK
jgi:HEAT repeat protein